MFAGFFIEKIWKISSVALARKIIEKDIQK